MIKQIKKGISRRKFLRFMGGGTLLALLPSLGWYLLENHSRKNLLKRHLGFTPLEPNSEDKLLMADGFISDILVKWRDPLNKRNERVGSHNDYLAFIPTHNSNDEGLLWINHEYMEPYFIHGSNKAKSRKDVNQEQKEVGGSIVFIRKHKTTGRWSYIKNHKWNRRLDATTKIPLIAPRPIENSKVAIGTLGNCAGGVTPWKTILTCEEGHANFYGDYTKEYPSGERKQISHSTYGWDQYFPYPAEHYGWVVEVNPITAKAKKLTSLGRFAHECATTIKMNDCVVVYMGDDSHNQCLYKFISKQSDSLEDGDLFVANIEKGEWLSLDYTKNKILQENFKDQTDILTYTRKAAHLVGGTPLDRPEDIAIDPKTGNIFISLTNNYPRGNHHGSLLKLEETNHQHLAMRFKASTFLTGGESNGFSCPDNLAFDSAGNLWFASDIGGSHKPEHELFKNNGLFYVPISGKLQGQVFQVASAPINAEITGIEFLLDGSLLASVQHPGEGTTNIKKPLSRWPNYGSDIPRSAVVVIHGPAMKKLLAQK